MATVADRPNPHAARFKEFLVRGVMVAHQRIAVEGDDAPLSDGARDRAQNVLRYALAEDEAWAATRELLLTLAPKMEIAGYREDWLQYLLAGLAQSQRLGDAQAEAALLFQCGYLHRLMSNHAEAQTMLSASAARCAGLQDTQGQARALNQWAYLAWQQSQYDPALALAQSAFDLLDDADPERGTSLSVLGLVALRRRQWQAAEEYHRQALSVRTEHAQRRQIAWSLQNLADALRGQGDLETAATYFEEAIALSTEIDDPLHRAIIQMNLGIVRQQQDQIDQALALYTRAESCFRRVADQLNLAKTLVNQGVSYLTLNQWQKAETTLRESANLFQQLNDQGEYLNALDGVGISALAQGDYAKALAIFETINSQLPQIEDTYFYQSLTMSIPNQLAQARAELDKAAR